MKYHKSIFWFRRDLRVEDNVGLYHALSQSEEVYALFIFDKAILNKLPKNDPRITYIIDQLRLINSKIHPARIHFFYDDVMSVFEYIIRTLKIDAVFYNQDYEPYAIERDHKLKLYLWERSIKFHGFKDQVIFDGQDILNDNSKPYTVFTAYKNKWVIKYREISDQSFPSQLHLDKLKTKQSIHLLNLENLPFLPNKLAQFTEASFNHFNPSNYENERDFPMRHATSGMSIKLRFGSMSIRHLVRFANRVSDGYLTEIIWREFFKMLLFHYPKLITEPFKDRFKTFPWKFDDEGFRRWKSGDTGYPIVDAGMRELNETGYMHNRVRMITASFLSKHLLIPYSYGENYFAEKLLDFDQSSNNGNWQWVAGCGADAAPFFRVFNPFKQQEKFDPDFSYIQKWVPEYQKKSYQESIIIDHKFAYQRVMDTYKHWNIQWKNRYFEL